MPARLLLAAVSGAALWLAFPGHDLWPMAFLGCAGLSVALWRCGPWRGALLGLVSGLCFFMPLLHWSGVYVGSLPWLALATLQAGYLAGLGLVVGLLQRRRLRPFAFALAIVAAELARATTPFGGFPWGRLAFSQADSPVVAIASLVGVPGVGFVVALAGALLPYAVLVTTTSVPLANQTRGSRPLRAVGAVAAAVALVLAPTLVPRPTEGTPVQVLAIQGNVPRLGLDFNAQRRAVLDNHARLTEQVAEQIAGGRVPAPDVVLWPENSSDIDPSRNPDAAAVIDQAVAAVDAPLVVGALQRSASGNNLNTALLYLPGQGAVQRYVKQRPVPFAEYIPYRDFFRRFSDKVDLVVRDFEAGDEVGLLTVPTASGELLLGVAICFEVVVDDLIHDTVLGGAEVLLVPTNNATFGLTDESVQQLAASRVRAVETHRSVVHISTVGVSALITPDGTAHEVTELFTADWLSGSLPARTDLTLAVRLGAWPERVAVLLLMALCAYQLWSGRRLGSSQPLARPRDDRAPG